MEGDAEHEAPMSGAPMRSPELSPLFREVIYCATGSALPRARVCCRTNSTALTNSGEPRHSSPLYSYRASVALEKATPVSTECPSWNRPNETGTDFLAARAKWA